MSFTNRLKNWIAKRAFGVLNDPDSWLVRHFAPQVLSGVTVNQHTSMKSTAVFAAVRLLSGTIASLPLPVYERLRPRGKQRAQQRPEYKLLHDRPNPEMSSFQWRQTGIAHQVLWGDWFNEIEYNERGAPVALWLIPPWRVQVARSKNGYIFYDVNLPDGGNTRLRSWQILHIKNLSVDGLRGMSCIRAGAEAIGLSLAAEEFGARFFGEGANMSGVAQHPNKLSDEAYNRLSKSLPEKYAGLGKSHRIMLLEEGMQYQRIGIPPNEAQFLETRKFQVAEIGRLFGISQLHKIGDLERATFSNIEQQNIEFVVDTIRPLLVNIEQEINFKLFDGKKYFSEFVIDGLLRGDTQTRYQAYSVGRQWGWLSADDVRELENMNPLPEGQGNQYLIPMNMIQAGEVEAPQLTEGNTGESERSSNPGKEKRNKNAAIARARVAKSHEKLFKENAQKICTREKNNVIKALNKHLNERGLSTFDEWLEDFYREFRPFVARTMKPAITGLAEAVKEMAAQEVNADDPDVQRMIDDFTEAQAEAHTIRSLAVIRQLINRAEEESLDTAEVITERLEAWEEERPKQIANDSTVAVSNRAAKAVFAGAGIQKLRWVAIGSETCELCESMDGKVVGIDQPFVAANDTVEGEGTSPLRVNKPTTEPPLHKGCVCEIIPD